MSKSYNCNKFNWLLVEILLFIPKCKHLSKVSAHANCENQTYLQ